MKSVLISDSFCISVFYLQGLNDRQFFGQFGMGRRQAIHLGAAMDLELFRNPIPAVRCQPHKSHSSRRVPGRVCDFVRFGFHTTTDVTPQRPKSGLATVPGESGAASRRSLRRWGERTVGFMDHSRLRRRVLPPAEGGRDAYDRVVVEAGALAEHNDACGEARITASTVVPMLFRDHGVLLRRHRPYVENRRAGD